MSEDAKNRIEGIEEMIQVVLLAIPREISSRNFYLNATKKATSDESRELIEFLAQQEMGHEAELRRILENLKKDLENLKKT